MSNNWEAERDAQFDKLLIDLADARRPGRAELVSAIRRFTVEMPNDQPNGEAERHLKALGDALYGRNLGKAAVAFEQYCEATVDDTQALREGAEAFFGGDFRKSETPQP